MQKRTEPPPGHPAFDAIGREGWAPEKGAGGSHQVRHSPPRRWQMATFSKGEAFIHRTVNSPLKPHSRVPRCHLVCCTPPFQSCSKLRIPHLMSHCCQTSVFLWRLWWFYTLWAHLPEAKPQDLKPQLQLDAGRYNRSHRLPQLRCGRGEVETQRTGCFDNHGDEACGSLVDL